MKDSGLIVVLSGPSGCGKSTILKKVLDENSKNKLSISTTTREMREGEENGKNYNFITREEFIKLIDNNEMLEYATYCDNFYGTPKKYVENMCEIGYNVILEIEVAGAMQIKQRYDNALMVFLMPPSFDILKKRLIGRDTEKEDIVKKRLEIALKEIKTAVQYDYVVVNDDVDECAKTVNDIINVRKNTTEYMEDFVIEVIKNATTID
ncbi:MAG: guanylate kinase [Oscillospiraceae bacterium]